MMNAIELRKLPLFAALGPDESSCLEHGEEISVAAGDARYGFIKRVASGVGEGTIAEKMIER